MKKIALALVLIAISSTASAVPVVLFSHNVTSGGGGIFTLNTDGRFPPGFAPASTAIWDWDGTTLTSAGLYSSTWRIGDSPFSLGGTLRNDQIMDLAIDTSIDTATATSYTCMEGFFPATVGFNSCGGYTFGPNFTDDSTTVWGPGVAVSQTLGGDDISTDGPRTISAYDFGLDGIVGVNGLNLGDQIIIGNGIALGSNVDGVGGEAMTFQVVPVPAAVWLFGSALGLLGWAWRKSA